MYYWKKRDKIFLSQISHYILSKNHNIGTLDNYYISKINSIIPSSTTSQTISYFKYKEMLLFDSTQELFYNYLILNRKQLFKLLGKTYYNIFPIYHKIHTCYFVSNPIRNIMNKNAFDKFIFYKENKSNSTTKQICASNSFGLLLKEFSLYSQKNDIDLNNDSMCEIENIIRLIKNQETIKSNIITKNFNEKLCSTKKKKQLQCLVLNDENINSLNLTNTNDNIDSNTHNENHKLKKRFSFYKSPPSICNQKLGITNIQKNKSKLMHEIITRIFLSPNTIHNTKKNKTNKSIISPQHKTIARLHHKYPTCIQLNTISPTKTFFYKPNQIQRTSIKYEKPTVIKSGNALHTITHISKRKIKNDVFDSKKISKNISKPKNNSSNTILFLATSPTFSFDNAKGKNINPNGQYKITTKAKTTLYLPKVN